MRVAVVDDDAEFGASVQALLEGAGHHAVCLTDGKAFLRMAKTETFDAVLLDWNLPGIEGIEIVRRLRGELANDVPVILLTLRTDADDVVEALDAGADDYVTKPVDDRILIARIEAVARRRGSARSDGATTFGNYTFDSAQDIVSFGNASVQLTSKEFQLALMLFRNASRPLSRAYLLESVWNIGPHVQTRTLDSHVARLRSKLELRPENGWRLAPIYSYGYRLEPIAPASEFADTGA